MPANTNAEVVAFISQRVHNRAEILRALYALLKDDVIKWQQIQSLVPATNDVISEGREGVSNMTNAELIGFMTLAQGLVSTVEGAETQALVSRLCIRGLEVTVSLPRG
jgi:hypothetical protein